MKAAAITAILAASLATAEVTWTFQKFENGTEVFSAGPQTMFQSQAMINVGEARKRNRLNGRASAATVTSSNWCGAALTGSGFTSVVGTPKGSNPTANHVCRTAVPHNRSCPVPVAILKSFFPSPLY
ncbi:hypothetical protein B0H13DRAFT_1879423 [Mycena leptocephala]|nr:hypothetical protein B0H13DRAFT_1879423 [Mycena leptocephala]